MKKIYNLQDNQAPTRQQLSWFLFFRVVVITLFLGGTIIYQLREGIDRTPPVISYSYTLIAISYLQTILSAILLPGVRRLKLFSQILVVWDLLFVTSVVYITGGIGSIFSFLFILVILSNGIFLTRREIFLVAASSAILYGSLLNLQYYDHLPLLEGVPFPEDVIGRNFFYAVFVNVIAFFLTAVLSGMLSERQRRSEQALEKKEVDLEELEKLNRTILANMTSGLMIINNAGRIRSFNNAAARISGFSLEEVYDRDIMEIFPQFHVFSDNGFQIVHRGEDRFIDRSGTLRVLGYASSLIEDPQEKTIGLLVTFQDLTHLKEMEDQLKRADRLAAVGRLASGMAHEIRNPLASISGSVQLLMENGTVAGEDHRLMKIVVKEANRLNHLLSDFLTYARPAPPKPEPVDISALLDELADIVRADPRFAGVLIHRDYCPGIIMRLDRERIRQALWNLLINGAEAMDGKGALRLAVDQEQSTICVEDSGPGIPDLIRDRIFDPFFTTKDQGTGLGLATVYTVVEAHGGEIDFVSGSAGGTSFTIRLPRRA
jgi:two-component system, NtrC family, sensor histidine kinase PilS